MRICAGLPGGNAAGAGLLNVSSSGALFFHTRTWRDAVKRSLITLKLLTFKSTGGLWPRQLRPFVGRGMAGLASC
jgi:hypothetical protein